MGEWRSEATENNFSQLPVDADSPVFSRKISGYFLQAFLNQSAEMRLAGSLVSQLDYCRRHHVCMWLRQRKNARLFSADEMGFPASLISQGVRSWTIAADGCICGPVNGKTIVLLFSAEMGFPGSLTSHPRHSWTISAATTCVCGSINGKTRVCFRLRWDFPEVSSHRGFAVGLLPLPRAYVAPSTEKRLFCFFRLR